MIGKSVPAVRRDGQTGTMLALTVMVVGFIAGMSHFSSARQLLRTGIAQAEYLQARALAQAGLAKAEIVLAREYQSGASDWTYPNQWHGRFVSPTEMDCTWPEGTMRVETVEPLVIDTGETLVGPIVDRPFAVDSVSRGTYDVYRIGAVGIARRHRQCVRLTAWVRMIRWLSPPSRG